MSLPKHNGTQSRATASEWKSYNEILYWFREGADYVDDDAVTCC